MAYIEIKHRDADAKGGRLSRTQAGALLGVSESSIDKLLRSGYLTSLSARDVLQLAGIAWAEPMAPIAVLRTSAEKEAAAWDSTRDVIGVSAGQTDATFLASNDRWWRTDANRIVELGCYAITISTFCVGILRVHGIRESQDYETDQGANHRRIWFTAELAARCARLGDPDSVTLYEAASKLPYDARALCGYRVSSSSGGPFAYLP